jgi:VWFA-related protein
MTYGFAAIALLGVSRVVCAQSDSGGDGVASYRLAVPVDEVVLTFHATDAHGLPVNDLKVEELTLLDNGRPAKKIVDFRSSGDRAIRAGLIVDTSESMMKHLGGDRAIAIQYAQRLMSQQTDEAFVMEFDRVTRILQPWSNDPKLLTAGVRAITLGGGRTYSGTAIFDTIYRACRYQFGVSNAAASSNFILLFSDGEENASSMSLKDAVDMCQRTNTSIYAFRADSAAGAGSTGPETLAALTKQTGGRVFHDDGTEDEIFQVLRTIEENLRSEYRLVYQPAEVKHDGSFHTVVLEVPDRVRRVATRSGYYAPMR